MVREVNCGQFDIPELVSILFVRSRSEVKCQFYEEKVVTSHVLYPLREVNMRSKTLVKSGLLTIFLSKKCGEYTIATSVPARTFSQNISNWDIKLS